LKKGPADFENILGTGVPYSDPDFKPNSDMIYWKDYPRTDGASLASFIP